MRCDIDHNHHCFEGDEGSFGKFYSKLRFERMQERVWKSFLKIEGWVCILDPIDPNKL